MRLTMPGCEPVMIVICPDYSEAKCGRCSHAYAHKQRPACPAPCGRVLGSGPCIDMNLTR